MKTARITILFLLGITAPFIFYGCLEENFIPDPSDPRLPKYTESGNQVGGALINNVAWKTDWFYDIDWIGLNRAFYFTNYSSGDSILLTMDGYYTEGLNKDLGVSIYITLKGITLDDFKSIKKLDEMQFSLDGVNNHVTISDYLGRPISTNGSGSIEFKNVKKFTCSKPDANDNQYCNAIIAGVFNLEFLSENIKVESGRFDFYINENYIDQR